MGLKEGRNYALFCCWWGLTRGLGVGAWGCLLSFRCRQQMSIPIVSWQGRWLDYFAARTPIAEKRWSAAALQAMKPVPVYLAMQPDLTESAVSFFSVCVYGQVYGISLPTKACVLYLSQSSYMMQICQQISTFDRLYSTIVCANGIQDFRQHDVCSQHILGVLYLTSQYPGCIVSASPCLNVLS